MSCIIHCVLVVYEVKYVYCLFVYNNKSNMYVLYILYILHIFIGNGYSHALLTSPPNPPLLNSPLSHSYTRGSSTLSRMYTTTPSLPRLLRPATIRYIYKHTLHILHCIYIHHLLHIFLH